MTKPSQRILIVEDDNVLADVLLDNLVLEGYEVQRVADGTTAVERTKTFAPDLILLDVALPDANGFELCGTFRRFGRTAIIILTARDRQPDKLRGLNLGADDYVTKPFNLEELLARIRAVLRRARPTIERISLGRISIDFTTFRAHHSGQPLHLTKREFEILRYLASNQDRVVFRDELLQQVWGYTHLPETRAVDHAIARLRKKIESDPHRPQFIQMGYGDGYYLIADKP